MTQIPDINTDNVSFLAYYNLSNSEIDGNFEPTQLNFGSSNNSTYSTPESTTYDNGYELIVEDHRVNQTITVRAGNKDYKWITAHIQDYTSQNGGEFTGSGTDINSYGYQGNKSGLDGEYDLMPWTDLYNSLYEPTENILFAVIEKCLSSTDYWTQTSLKLENTGLYNYTVADQAQETSIFCGDDSSDRGMSFTDVTTIHKAYLVGATEAQHKYDNRLYINDTEAHKSNDDADAYFAYDVTDILANEKQLKVGVTRTPNAKYYCIVVWS